MENIIVIGGGLMGSAAAWQLSQYGEQVLLLEQQSTDYKTGSSYGDSRIARSLGPEGDIFSYIHNRSAAEAERLIAFLNTAGNGVTHSMDDIYTTSPVTYMFDATGGEAVTALCHKEQPDRYEKASHANAYKVFGMTIPESATVIREYSRYSGMLNPKVLIAKLHTGVQLCGNRVLFGHKTVAMFRREGHYEVETVELSTRERKVLHAEKLVVAAGPYTGELLERLAPQFKELITPKRVFSAFFRVKTAVFHAFTDEEKEKIRLSQPVYFQYDGMFYSMIDRIGEDGSPVFKAGGHAIYDAIGNLDECWKIRPSNENIEWAGERMYRYLKSLNISLEKDDLEYVHSQSCVYSLTASGIPVVTPVQGENNLIVMGGMNGIGAKGSLCYGLIAANRLLGRQENDPMYKKTADALCIG